MNMVSFEGELEQAINLYGNVRDSCCSSLHSATITFMNFKLKASCHKCIVASTLIDPSTRILYAAECSGTTKNCDIIVQQMSFDSQTLQKLVGILIRN